MKAHIKYFLVIIFFLLKTKTALGNESIKIGLLAPFSGEFEFIGNSVIGSTKMALKKINNNNIYILPRDTRADNLETIKKVEELYIEGVRIFIGPIFNKNLIGLDKYEDAIFLSLTNKVLNNPKNVISSGINANSQFRAIKKFLKENDLKQTLVLIPKKDYKEEIEEAIKDSKLNSKKIFYYDTEPTKLTKQIEKVTRYQIRKQNLADEIQRIKESNEPNKERKIKNLEKKYTIGNVNFDAIVISDFDESLKSVATSLLYTDVSPKNKYFITLNQWFDESLIEEINIQPIYYPSINKENFDNYKIKYFNAFNENPSHLSLLSYDLVGLVYYLSLKSDLSKMNKIFKKKNSFKGKIGIFDIKENKINHRLNFYKIEDKKLIEIF